MCQLLGMNCNVPTDICFSFEGFRARGGKTGEHADGWGIAFFEGKGCRLFLDDKPSSNSPIADLVRSYPIRSINTIAHIRKATHGQVALVNTHPFQREMWGSHWVFAHNGDLKDFQPKLDGIFQPVGDTDSEMAFCYILQRLHKRYIQTPLVGEELFGDLLEISEDISQYGIFNYLLSNGEFLFAYCGDSLHYIIRQAPFSTAHLIDEDMTIDFNEVTTPNDRAAMIATTPLTDNEVWTPFAKGQLLLFRQGIPIAGVYNSQEEFAKCQNAALNVKQAI